jgi:hypothetical protein
MDWRGGRGPVVAGGGAAGGGAMDRSAGHGGTFGVAHP